MCAYIYICVYVSHFALSFFLTLSLSLFFSLLWSLSLSLALFSFPSLSLSFSLSVPPYFLLSVYLLDSLSLPSINQSLSLCFALFLTSHALCLHARHEKRRWKVSLTSIWFSHMDELSRLLVAQPCLVGGGKPKRNARTPMPSPGTTPLQRWWHLHIVTQSRGQQGSHEGWCCRAFRWRICSICDAKADLPGKIRPYIYVDLVPSSQSNLDCSLLFAFLASPIQQYVWGSYASVLLLNSLKCERLPPAHGHRNTARRGGTRTGTANPESTANDSPLLTTIPCASLLPLPPLPPPPPPPQSFAEE